MSKIRIQLASEFRGEAVVLLAMDQGGLNEFSSAVSEAIQGRLGYSSQLRHADGNHVFALKDHTADIDLQPCCTTWRFSTSKLAEVLEKLNAMKSSPGPCHHYVDIASPTETLVLSRDEYV